VDGEEDGADRHKDVGGDLHSAARDEHERGHRECSDAKRDPKRLVRDPLRQGQQEERPDLGRDERERTRQDGGTKQRQEQPVVETLQQIGSQFTTEGMTQETVL
jgi:hypothetical protein